MQEAWIARVVEVVHAVTIGATIAAGVLTVLLLAVIFWVEWKRLP